MSAKSVCLTSVVLLLGLAGTNAVAQVDPTLVGWWRFEEASGTLFDETSNHNDGTPVNGVLYQQAGQVGYALGFDGVDDYVTVGTTGRPSDTFSFGAWLRTSSTHEIEAEATTGTGGTSNQRYAFDPRHGGDQNGGAGLSVGTNGIAVYEHGSNYMPTTAAYPTDLGDDWNHIMVVYKDKVPTIYLNGRAVHTGLKSPREIVYAPIQFGGMTYGYFEGLMDEVRIYNRALSAAEMKRLAPRQKAYGPIPADGAQYFDTWVSLSWEPGDYAVSHNVYLGDNFDDVSAATLDSDVFRGHETGTYFIAGLPDYPYPDGLVPGTTYYWRIDEVNDADPNSPWEGFVWSFSIPPRTAYDPDPADGAEFVDPDELTLSWTRGFGAKLHTVYFGETFDDVNNATGGFPQGITTYQPSALELGKVYYWRVDEFDAAATYKGEVWSFTTPGAVGNPQPAHGATDVGINATLSWTPADGAASHELYFGTNEDAVRGADAASPEYQGTRSLGDESFDPGMLQLNTSYYWRVDEVDAQGNVSTGPLWVFTTGAFLLVDDFESYTDDDGAGQAIWQTWIDGFGVADNGAQVGYLMPPYAEQTVVHGGSQSMPLLYVNEDGVANSEASMTLTAPRDWTQAGVTELSLWFQGSAGNAAEPLYAAISNATGAPAIVANDDPHAATVRTWTQWRIPLQAFADQGIDLSNVNEIAIGLGDKSGKTAPGGSGTTYFDDIRLY
ncbi:MAG: LamG domain-containing protein [Sedimentisphaerales bacterium]|jgi:hypothetical protein